MRLSKPKMMPMPPSMDSLSSTLDEMVLAAWARGTVRGALPMLYLKDSNRAVVS